MYSYHSYGNFKKMGQMRQNRDFYLRLGPGLKHRGIIATWYPIQYLGPLKAHDNQL